MVTSRADGDLGAWVILTEDPDYNPATADYCREVRDAFGLTMPVLYDPEQRFAAAFSQPRHHVHVVMGAGNEILYSEYYPDEDSVIAAIDAALAGAP